MDLFHDSLIDALGSAVQAAGGVKKVAGHLWPSMDSSSSAAKLRACLNPEQAHKLSPDELVHVAMLARTAGDHSIMNYLAQALGYDTPRPVSPEDQALRLQREFIEAVQTVARISAQLGRCGIKAA